MRYRNAFAAIVLGLAANHASADEVGCVTSTWKLVGI